MPSQIKDANADVITKSQHYEDEYNLLMALGDPQEPKGMTEDE